MSPFDPFLWLAIALVAYWLGAAFYDLAMRPRPFRRQRPWWRGQRVIVQGRRRWE